MNCTPCRWWLKLPVPLVSTSARRVNVAVSEDDLLEQVRHDALVDRRRVQTLVCGQSVKKLVHVEFGRVALSGWCLACERDGALGRFFVRKLEVVRIVVLGVFVLVVWMLEVSLPPR
jgi:hypothetical protein